MKGPDNEPQHNHTLMEWDGTANMGEHLFRQSSFFPSLLESRANSFRSHICLASTSVQYSFATFLSLVAANAIGFLHQGVKKGSAVGIVSESSPESTIALLAVLKIGALCVPLGPSIPENRIRSIARICNLTHLVALTNLSQQLDLPNVVSLTLRLGPLAPVQELATDLLAEHDPETPAIVLFTSGSTGEPKGVVHTHASISTMALTVANALRLDVDERNFLFPSFGWAVNIIDTLATLTAGACLCIATEFQKSQGLEQVIRQFEATRMTLPTSVLAIIEPNSVSSLTTIIIAGEPIREDLMRAWTSRVTVIWNYGSSETLMLLAGMPDLNKSSNLNSGRALPSSYCYVVDENGTQVPHGTPGELIIEGYTNLMGYMQDGKVCKSQQGKSGCVVVRSGDLFEVDTGTGILMHRGRIDSQLKILGQRFEPQEVEKILWATTTNIQEFIVTVATLKGNSNGPAVVALVVPKDKAAAGDVSGAHLHCSFEQVARTLPPYMIPVGALKVKQLPKLGNGKIDRKGAVRLADQQHVADLVDLRSSHEIQSERYDILLASKIAAIWARVLKLSISDVKSFLNFFLLGGNSLVAMSTCKELCQAGILVSVSDIFSRPTLRDMVQSLSRSADSDLWKVKQSPKCQLNSTEDSTSRIHQMAAERCGIDIALVEEVYPCTPLQAGLMALSEFQQGVYVAHHEFRLPDSWTRTSFIQAWLRVVRKTPILRSRIVLDLDGRPYNVTIRYDAETALPSVHIPRSSTMTFGTRLFFHGLSSSEGISHDGLRWHWQVHHAIYDRWSTNLILETIRKEYMMEEVVDSMPFSWFARIVEQQGRSEQARVFWKSGLESFNSDLFPEQGPEHHVHRAS